jgi:hypothetical protein
MGIEMTNTEYNRRLLPTLLLAVMLVVLATFGIHTRAEDTGYQLVRVMEVEGRQGVATDGNYYYVSSSTALYRYSKTGKLLLSNTGAVKGLPVTANHIGDISLHKGEIYAGVEFFEDGVSKDIQVAIYDADTLEYKRAIAWEPESGQAEVSAIAVDPVRNAIWMTDWTNGRYLYRYDLKAGTYTGKLHLRPPPQWQQGIAVNGDYLYITADDGDAEDEEHDNLWRVPAETDSTAAYVTHEHTFKDFKRVGEIEGIAFDDVAGEMVVLANRGERIILGMPSGLYPGYTHEIHELYIYKVPD